MKHAIIWLAVMAVSPVPGSLSAQQGPVTVAEASGFTATSLHADVMEFVAELQRLSPLVRVESMGTSTEGRTIPLLVIGDPVPRSPIDLRYDDRAVVYIQANIFVERNSQKRILVGKGGSSIRELGSRSREKIESFLGRKVYLDLWIKVLADWRRKRGHLKKLGFRIPEEGKGG